MPTVREAMTPNPVVCSPDTPLQAIARQMKDSDTGFIPLGEGGKLYGVITDRDLVIKAFAAGADASTPVREYASTDVETIREDADLGEVKARMQDRRIRRLPVVDETMRVVGVVTLGDFVLEAPEDAAEALLAVSTDEPGRGGTAAP